MSVMELDFEDMEKIFGGMLTHPQGDSDANESGGAAGGW